MTDFDISKLKLKVAEDLNEPERQFIIEHRSELNDEDTAAYSSFLPNDEKPSEASTETPAPNNDSQPTATDNTPTDKPVTQADLDRHFASLLEQQNKLLESFKPQSTNTEPIKPQKPTFFEEGKLPSDWNEALVPVYEKAKSDAVEEFKKMTAEEKQAELQRQEAIVKVREGFENEYKQLESEGKIPKLDTEEGKLVKQQIFDVGNKYGYSNIKESYETWSKIGVEFGGGYKPNSAEKQRQDKADLKKAASQVGGGGGSKPSQGIDYSKIHNKPLSELVEEALR